MTQTNWWFLYRQTWTTEQRSQLCNFATGHLCICAVWGDGQAIVTEDKLKIPIFANTTPVQLCNFETGHLCNCIFCAIVYSVQLCNCIFCTTVYSVQLRILCNATVYSVQLCILCKCTMCWSSHCERERERERTNCPATRVSLTFYSMSNKLILMMTMHNW